MINRKPCGQQSWYIPGLCTISTSLNRLKKTTRNLTQNNQSLLQYSWLRVLKYEKEVITSQLYSSIPDTPIHKKQVIILLINPFIVNQIIYAIWVGVLTLRLSYIFCVLLFFCTNERHEIYKCTSTNMATPYSLPNLLLWISQPNIFPAPAP